MSIDKRDPECPICLELSASAKSRLAAAVKREGVRNCVLAFSEHLAVIPSLGPLVAGHSLVVTRYHASSILRENILDEMLGLIEPMRRNWTRPHEALLCFEHCGMSTASGEEACLCTTEHAHLHVLPMDRKVCERILQRVAAGGNWSAISAIPLTDNYVTAFSLDTERESQKATMDATRLPAQFLRRMVAEELGLAQWDWKKDPAGGLGWLTAAASDLNVNLLSEPKVAV